MPNGYVYRIWDRKGDASISHLLNISGVDYKFLKLGGKMTDIETKNPLPCIAIQRLSEYSCWVYEKMPADRWGYIKP